jgi:ferredoxin
MKFTIKVDPDLCMGVQRCTFVAPAVFGIGEDGVAEVKDASGLTVEEAWAVAAECPNLAIAVVEYE